MAEGGSSENKDAHVLIPCEFCDGLFPFNEVMQHMSGCYTTRFQSSKPEKKETFPQRSQVNTAQPSEQRNAETTHGDVFKIVQNVRHEVFDMEEMGDGFILKKISTKEDSKVYETTEKHGEVDKQRTDPKPKDEERNHQDSKKHGDLDKQRTDPKPKDEERNHQDSKKHGDPDKQRTDPKPKDEERNHQDSKKHGDLDKQRTDPKPKDDEERSHQDSKKPGEVDKQRADPKPKDDEEGNHQDSKKSHVSDYDDNGDISDMSDDNNPENITVEYFIQRAYDKFGSRRKTR